MISGSGQWTEKVFCLTTDHHHSSFYTPGRIFAIFAGVKEADIIAIGISKIGLPPEPWAVGGVFVKGQAERLEAFYLSVEVFAFEIESYALVRPYVIGDVDGERRFAVGALESGVSGQGIDDTPEAELFEELHGLKRVLGIDRNLVEVHLGSEYLERFRGVITILALGMFIDDGRKVRNGIFLELGRLVLFFFFFKG